MRQLVNRQLRSPRGHETGCNSLRRTPLGRAIQKAPRLQQFSTAPPPRAPLAPCAATPQLAAMALDEAAKKAVITDSIRGIPDFPHKGILFWDVTTIMLNHEAFKYTIELFAEHYKDKKVDVIAGESRLSLSPTASARAPYLVGPHGLRGPSPTPAAPLALQASRPAVLSSVLLLRLLWARRSCPCASLASCQVGQGHTGWVSLVWPKDTARAARRGHGVHVATQDHAQ